MVAIVLDDLEQGRDLLRHPGTDRRLRVVRALDEGRAIEVADEVARRVGDEVVDVAVGGADPAVGHALDEVLERDVDVGGAVDAPAGFLERGVERLGLDLRPREAVEDRAGDRIRRLESVEEDAHDGVVRNELAATHVAVRLAPEGRAISHGLRASRSPDARTGTPSRLASAGACVPLPAPGAPSRTMTVIDRADAAVAYREARWTRSDRRCQLDRDHRMKPS